MRTLIPALALVAFSSAQAAVVVSVARGGSGDQADFAANSGQTFTTGVLGTDNLLSMIDLVGPRAAASGSLGPFTVKI